jgi:hypothetical protein
MKTLKIIGLIIALVVSSLALTASAESSKSVNKVRVRKHQDKKHHMKKKKIVKKTVKKADTEETAKLSTDINFNDSVLHGRYQTPDDATAKVENEKTLSDLLAVRTQFKDRLKKSSEQN